MRGDLGLQHLRHLLSPSPTAPSRLRRRHAPPHPRAAPALRLRQIVFGRP